MTVAGDDLSSLMGMAAGLDPSLSGIIIGVIVIGMVFFFLALLSMTAYFTILMSVAMYAYPVARVKAIGVPYLQSSPVSDLLESPVYRDALSRVQSAGYPVDLSGEGSSSQIEHDCEGIFLREAEILARTAPADVVVFFAAYLSLLEIREIKRALRMIHGRISSGRMRADIRAVGWITPDMVRRFAECSSIDELVSLLQGTAWSSALAGELPAYHDQNTTLPLELALDHAGYTRLNGAVMQVASPLAVPYREIVSIAVDIQNMTTLIRAKHTGCDPGISVSWLLEGGHEFPMWRLLQLNEILSVPDLVAQVSGTRYDGILVPFMERYPGPDAFHRLDIATDRYMLHELNRISVVYYHTGGPLIEYCIGKGMELNNIRVILTGLALGLDRTVIRPDLVVMGE